MKKPKKDKNSTNLWVLAGDGGAGYYFINSKPAFCIKHISVSAVSGKYRKISSKFLEQGAANRFRASPVLSCLLCCFYTIGTLILSLLKGEADKFKNCEFFLLVCQNQPTSLIGAASAPCFAYKRRMHRHP
jgi:hypothetical protein